MSEARTIANTIDTLDRALVALQDVGEAKDSTFTGLVEIRNRLIKRLAAK